MKALEEGKKRGLVRMSEKVIREGTKRKGRVGKGKV